MVDARAPFSIRASDVGAVTSALAAAERSWNRGERTAVIRWLQRASEAAVDAADDARALELAECARELAREGAPAARPPLPSSPASSVHLLTKLAQPKHLEPASSRPSLAGEVARARGSSPGVFEEDTNQVAIFQLRDEIARRKKAEESARPPPLPSPPKRSQPADLPTRAHVRDEWAIETVAGDDAAPDVYRPAPEAEPTRPAREPVQAVAAVRVLLWRDAEGALYVTTTSAEAPPNAIQAVLTALDPSADLVGLLEDPT